VKLERWAGWALAAILSSCSAEPLKASPSAAVVLVLDASGSMAGMPIDFLKESRLAAAKEVGSNDFIGILAFNAEARWVVPLGPGGRDAAEAIGALKAEGPSDLGRALAETRRGFKANGSRKGVLVISDGDTSPGDFETIVREMRSDGVAFTAVCVGSAPKFDAALMSQIAGWGDGRFIFTQSFKHVPKILVHETRHLLRP
jgi:Ca-activated chloride channel homolog